MRMPMVASRFPAQEVYDRAATDADAAPQRSFRQMGPERVARLMREGAITGLALSGRPNAARVIAEIIESLRG